MTTEKILCMLYIASTVQVYVYVASELVWDKTK